MFGSDKGGEPLPFLVSKRRSFHTHVCIDALRNHVHAAAPNAEPAKNAIHMAFANKAGFFLQRRKLRSRATGDVDTTGQNKNRNQNKKEPG